MEQYVGKNVRVETEKWTRHFTVNSETNEKWLCGYYGIDNFCIKHEDVKSIKVVD